MSQITVIRGGTVVDGTGAPGYRADVALAGGKVTEIGSNLSGDREIDAGGAVVAPGFIDIHTHYDAQVFWDPALTPSCFHGVTTVVAGNCGFSVAPTRSSDRGLIASTLEKVEDMDPAALNAGIPWDFETFPEYLASVERRGAALNFAALIGHTPLRLYVMGEEASSRVATPDEVDRMVAIVREALAAGAAGFASSFAVTHRGADGRPIPSRYADRAEIDALFRAVGEHGVGVVAVNGGDNLSFADCYDLQPTIGAPITYTALLTSPSGMHLKFLEIHEAGTARGAQVWPQVSCRPLAFSTTLLEPFTLNINPVFAELMAGTVEQRRAAYADPAWRAKAKAAWTERQALVPRWDTFDIMESVAHPELIGRRLVELAAERSMDPFDLLLDLALAEPDLKTLRARSILLNDDAEGIATLLRAEGCTLGLSDAGAHVGQMCDAPLPTDLLGNWVRDRGVLTVEQAVHKLTKVQADLFGFAGRGVLAPGAHADVVVFEPDTVAPGALRRLNDFPAGSERLTADRPSGVREVIVNGTPVVHLGTLLDQAVEQRPGAIVRPSARS